MISTLFGCFNEFSRCNVESRENIFILVMTMAHMSDVEKILGKEVLNTMQDSALNGEISDDGMGWDKLSVLVSPPLKNLLNLIK